MALHKVKKKLSKSVLEMKFMKKSKQRVLAEQEAEESRSMYKNEITDKMNMDKFVSETSYAKILNLIVGRVSYHGMNPEVEKFMTRVPQDEERRRGVKRERGGMTLDVTDLEMARKFAANKKRHDLSSDENEDYDNDRPRKSLKREDDDD